MYQTIKLLMPEPPMLYPKKEREVKMQKIQESVFFFFYASIEKNKLQEQKK